MVTNGWCINFTNESNVISNGLRMSNRLEVQPLNQVQVDFHHLMNRRILGVLDVFFFCVYITLNGRS